MEDLERFLRENEGNRLSETFEELGKREDLWIGNLKLEEPSGDIRSLTITPWNNKRGIASWSGLRQEHTDEPPVLTIDPNAAENDGYTHVEVRWKPDRELEKNAVQYHVAIVSDHGDELLGEIIPHAKKKEQKYKFSHDDLAILGDDVNLAAKIVVSVVGKEGAVLDETPEFRIRTGEADAADTTKRSAGSKIRTLSEGMIECPDLKNAGELVADEKYFSTIPGFAVFRNVGRSKSYRIPLPVLLDTVEKEWFQGNGGIGRWVLKVRSSGSWAHQAPEFVQFDPAEADGLSEEEYNKLRDSSKKMANHLSKFGGGVGHVYDPEASSFETVRNFLTAWETALLKAPPNWTLANTVEIQNLSGKTVGLIVLPTHPLRVAWHAAYDNLVLHARYGGTDGKSSKAAEVVKEMTVLDGALFPAFLPGLEQGETFIFGEMFGFHAVGMIPSDDSEPKAALAVLARALENSKSDETSIGAERYNSVVLGKEILKYVDCHSPKSDEPDSNGQSVKPLPLLKIHAIRPGDGKMVVRSLGFVQDFQLKKEDISDDPSRTSRRTSFILELYSKEPNVVGRFISETSEKRRKGVGSLGKNDQWMLKSVNLPNGVTYPRLRWGKKDGFDPETAAHLAVVFDAFRSDVRSETNLAETPNRPFFAYGLLSFFERQFVWSPSTCWYSYITAPTEGERHPGKGKSTERLTGLVKTIQNAVACNLGEKGGTPILFSELSEDNREQLQKLHGLCDWVITFDRNAGIEYFDSPSNNRKIYETFVIDCAPEREDIGSVQLIASTSRLDEVRNILEGALDHMGLSRSRKNTEFLLDQLKALSGRLAMRLTGSRNVESELIALSMFHHYCSLARDNRGDWPSLRDGFLVPIDDIIDLFPFLYEKNAAPQSDDEMPPSARRSDLIYVSIGKAKTLSFRFLEIKYRQHLRSARDAALVETIHDQLQVFRQQWDSRYEVKDNNPVFRNLRLAKLARVLGFYLDKARRHANDENKTGLSEETYSSLKNEIYGMVAKKNYEFSASGQPDQGWIFCSEYNRDDAEPITLDDAKPPVFLFGPSYDFRSNVKFEVPLEEGPKTVEDDPGENTDSGDDGEPKEAFGDSETSTKKRKSEEEDASTRLETETSVQPAGSEKVPPPILLGYSTLNRQDIFWAPNIKGNPHLLVAGLPGMGKTTCLLNLCKQMHDQGIVPIVFSYHQDFDEKLTKMVGSVRLVKSQDLGFNPLRVPDRTSPTAYLDTIGAMRDIFSAIYPEFGDIQLGRIRAAIRKSFCEKGWDDKSADLERLEEPEFSRFYDLLFYENTEKKDKVLETITLRLEELSDYGFFNSKADSHDLWSSRDPVIICLHDNRQENVQKAFSSLIFYGLYQDMFRRGLQDRITHAVIFDEAHRASRLSLIPTMAKECRKYGISLIVASQEAKDFHSSLFSAIANYLILRLNDNDARSLAKNIVSSDQEKTLTNRIKELSKFHAFYSEEGMKKPISLLLKE